MNAVRTNKAKPSFANQLKLLGFNSEPVNQPSLVKKHNSIQADLKPKNQNTEQASKAEAGQELKANLISLIGIFTHYKIPNFATDNELKQGSPTKIELDNKTEERAKKQMHFCLDFMQKVQSLQLPQYDLKNKEYIRNLLSRYTSSIISLEDLENSLKVIDEALISIEKGNFGDLTRMTKKSFTLTQQLLVYSLFLGSDFKISENIKLSSNKIEQSESKEYLRCVRFRKNDFIGHIFDTGDFIPSHTHFGVCIQNGNFKTNQEGHFYLKNN
jgi:hypothetical protein